LGSYNHNLSDCMSISCLFVDSWSSNSYLDLKYENAQNTKESSLRKERKAAFRTKAFVGEKEEGT